MLMVPLAPVIPMGAICMGCSGDMRVVRNKFANGKLQSITFYCDTCKYGHAPSLIHAQGTAAPYVAPKPEEAKEDPRGGFAHRSDQEV